MLPSSKQNILYYKTSRLEFPVLLTFKNRQQTTIQIEKKEENIH